MIDHLSSRSLPGLALVAALLAAPAPAQSLLYVKPGDKANDRLGASVRAAGDVNQDTRPDFVVGAPEDGYVFGSGEGFARVYSGVNGTTLWTFNGENSGDVFGTSVDGAGDVNLDGYADIVVGAPQYSASGNLRGRVYVYSGRFGTLLWAFDGSVNNEQLGEAVAGAGDVDQDGYADVIAGSKDAPGGGSLRGLVRVYSGRTGTVLRTLTGAANGERLGLSLDGVGDMNGDGYADFAVGSLTAGVRVYSGQTGAVLRTFTATTTDDVLSASVAGIGDVTGDGIGDLLVGATQDGNLFNLGPGYVRVYNLAAGTLVRTLIGGTVGDRFGIAVADARDLTGDGRPEILVGADQSSTSLPGYARVFDGANGNVLATLYGLANGDHFGASVDGLGDADGAVGQELAIGAPNHTGAFQLDGRAEVWTASFPSCPVPYAFCAATNNSTGQPALIAHSGSTSIASNDFSLLCSGLPPSTFGLFYYGATQIQVPFGNGFRCVGGTAFRLGVQQVTPAGTIARPIDYGSLPPSGAITVGSIWKFQFWYRNPLGGGAGFNLSDGLSATFCN